MDPNPKEEDKALWSLNVKMMLRKQLSQWIGTFTAQRYDRFGEIEAINAPKAFV
jgi:hypothetical protein